MKKLFVFVVTLVAVIAAPAPVEAGLFGLFSGNRKKEQKQRATNNARTSQIANVNGNGNVVNQTVNNNTVNNYHVDNRRTNIVMPAPTMSGYAARDGRFTGGGRTSSCTPGDPYCRRELRCPNGQPAEFKYYRMSDGRIVTSVPPRTRILAPRFVDDGPSAPAPQYRRQSPPPQYRRPAPRPSGPPPTMASQGRPMRHPSGSVHPNGYYTVWWAQGPGWGN